MGISSAFNQPGNNCSQQATSKPATKMLRIVGLTVLALATHVLAKHYLTPLEIDNAPCKAENIKGQVRYTCDLKGNITCQHGWTKDNDTDPLIPCATPVCSSGCVHGLCEGPDLCACDVGWEGVDCNTCIDLPGCVHGNCSGQGLACVCNDKTAWQGGFCDIPICNNCVNGKCVAPGQCKCHPGWSGSNCDQCVALAGCNPNGGSCVDPKNATRQVPNGCICKDDFTGHLCDEPDCSSTPCISGHGECIFGFSNQTNPICKCNNGWEGADCGTCRKYPKCPLAGTCSKPNECTCSDPNEPLCNIQNKK